MRQASSVSAALERYATWNIRLLCDPTMIRGELHTDGVLNWTLGFFCSIFVDMLSCSSDDISLADLDLVDVCRSPSVLHYGLLVLGPISLPKVPFGHCLQALA